MDMLHSFIDSTNAISRLSIRLKDVGAERMDELYYSIRKDVDAVFPNDKYDVTVTGSTIVSYKGNQYLIGNLFASLALAIGLIAVFMSIMFNSKRMVLMSLVPNVIVSGRSVLSLRVIHGTPITVVSSVMPPESVMTALDLSTR